ncbi:phosphoribosylamine--glycine ligase [Desulfotomaculum arcticum]|uniref:Phosphoribosylamine--glycine ligase n=1 Tax=Desulfotruncus arcticus DSM 17038 TaxID=1121424 RepID=A0A1I2MYI4_9FIRM|nr:phosphoribosylamine--glycine ligase [Desulfotruncus arcticus]SFF96665.1 phosphoribosylamine--glycine ligase [Desulfotomaculum arcticum] [Desulfotruncus arcticus DSM 17038]
MKVLVVGGGGREHALVWKLSRSPRVKKIFCAPGNAGISSLAECVNIQAENIPAIVDLVRQHKFDLTVVGPEAPLVAGLVDRLEAEGYPVFGPRQRAAELEGSKVLAKEVMRKYNIPTAEYEVFEDAAEARSYIRKVGVPCVIKADGLAAGKGVIVAEDEQVALDAIDFIMRDRAFGAAGTRIVIEECLRGEEVSLLAFTDGEQVIPMIPAQDHKRVFDEDKGLNTGGMGAYAPAPVLTEAQKQEVMEKVMIPTVRGMAQEDRPYKGVLYAGLMMTEKGPKVLEFNARFGDPEAQPILMMLESDLDDVIGAILAGELNKVNLRWSEGAAVCVVLASGGYPGDYAKGLEISGLDAMPENVVAFHSGTAMRNGRVVTAGGRVLGITAKSGSISEAIDQAYQGVSRVRFEGMHYRRDIGQKALGK